VKSLLESGSKVDAVDVFHNTPLLTAVFLGHVGVSKLLIEEGKANVNVANQDGMTPLHYVINYFLILFF
jgi:ankyrin repeat protein